MKLSGTETQLISNKHSSDQNDNVITLLIFLERNLFTSNPTALHDWQYEGLREKSLNCVGFAWTKEVCMFVCLTAYFVNIVINTNILIFIKI